MLPSQLRSGQLKKKSLLLNKDNIELEQIVFTLHFVFLDIETQLNSVKCVFLFTDFMFALLFFFAVQFLLVNLMKRYLFITFITPSSHSRWLTQAAYTAI